MSFFLVCVDMKKTCFVAMFFLASLAMAVENNDSRITPVVRAYRLAGPAVVNISTTKTVAVRMGLFGKDPFSEIFQINKPRRRVAITSLGSGIIISPDGYIVTNAHVVQRAQIITITFPDKSTCEAHVVSLDSSNDLAIIKVPPRGVRAWPYLPLGRSDDIMVGETVIAIGNPLGLANTLSTGVISALNRTLTFSGGVKYSGLIQTDAPINHGNSGGPLLNIKGELIGINTAIRPDAQNIGFAIPIDVLTEKLPALLDFERLNRVLFGASVRQRPARAGGEIYVTEVRPKTPAHGLLQVGDQITGVGAKSIGNIAQFVLAMLEVTKDQTLAFHVIRSGKSLVVNVDIRVMPSPDGRGLARSLTGMKLREITPELASLHRLGASRGLLVIDVEKGSPAGQVGVAPKDILFHVGGFTVKDFASLGRILEDSQAGQTVQIGILRGNTVAMVNIRLRPQL